MMKLTITSRQKKPKKLNRIGKETCYAFAFIDSFQFLSSSVENLANAFETMSITQCMLSKTFGQSLDEGIKFRKGHFAFNYFTSLERLNDEHGRVLQWLKGKAVLAGRNMLLHKVLGTVSNVKLWKIFCLSSLTRCFSVGRCSWRISAKCCWRHWTRSCSLLWRTWSYHVMVFQVYQNTITVCERWRMEWIF